jgi:hypothetical protein
LYYALSLPTAHVQRIVEAVSDLLASKDFQRRNSPHLTYLLANCGIPAAALPLSGCLPCPWSQLRHLSWLTVGPSQQHAWWRLNNLEAACASQVTGLSASVRLAACR